MAAKPRSKKEIALELFEKGYTHLSPEVKALKLAANTRYNYWWEWKNGKLGAQKERIGDVNETRPQPEPEVSVSTPVESPTEIPLPEEDPANEPLDDLPGEPDDFDISQEILGDNGEKPTDSHKRSEEFGNVSEAIATKNKDGRSTGPERKISTTIVEDGIKCTVFLSLQTLALYRIARTKQTEMNPNDGDLPLGDFLDSCVQDFFEVRGKKLGLIRIGGK